MIVVVVVVSFVEIFVVDSFVVVESSLSFFFYRFCQPYRHSCQCRNQCNEKLLLILLDVLFFSSC